LDEPGDILDWMKRLIGQHYVLIASDVVHDGIGVELWDEERNLAAEVFRCDADKTVLLNTFGNAVPLDVLESFTRFARESLDPFEDGTSLPAVEPIQNQEIAQDMALQLRP
jgi:hypothetical protein